MLAMSGHPELVDLLAVACGREAYGDDVGPHVLTCQDCSATLTELSDLAEPVAIDAELDTDLADLNASAFVAGPAASLHPVDVARRRIDQLLEPTSIDVDEVCAEIAGLRGDPSFGHFLLLLCQRVAPRVPRDPAGILRLAQAVESEASFHTGEVPNPQLVRAEALLLASSARLHLGENAGARADAVQARSLAAGLPGAHLTIAVADTYEANAASFLRDYEAAGPLLRTALKTFAAYGQDHWVGRVLLTQATLVAQRGENAESLPLFDEALKRLDPHLDTNVVVAALVNKASTLSHLDRVDEARAAYARALQSALRFRIDYAVQVIRNGLAEIDFKRGDLARALTSFRRLAARAKEAGYSEDYAFAQLYVAECLGRLGREPEMRSTLLALQHDRGSNAFSASPAFDELFTCLDRGELDAGLVAHVREYLEACAAGESAPYRPLRLRA
jgi:tetratricopeptide (TPR) repeat protein